MYACLRQIDFRALPPPSMIDPIIHLKDIPRDPHRLYITAFLKTLSDEFFNRNYFFHVPLSEILAGTVNKNI